MSMHTGGLAQMSYNHSLANGNVHGLGLPGSGFAARRAGNNTVKRLSFEPPAMDAGGHGLPTPRTSRSHLLAGLRTAPKTAYNMMPSTAPATQQHFSMGPGMAASMYAQPEMPLPPRSGSIAQPNPYNHPAFQRTEQILSPPDLMHGQDQMDPGLYAQLVATNLYLAEQQQRLQHQLKSVQAAAHQMQMLGLDPHGQQLVTPPITPQNMHLFQQQQVQSQMQPIITPVPGAQPGVYSYYNPVTGQQTYFVDNGARQADHYDPVMQTADYSPPQQPGTPRFQVSPPPNEDAFVSMSPPKKTSSPPNVTPLPPPSAGAFRRGHRKAESLAFDRSLMDGSRGILTPKVAGMPPMNTPTSAGFGPGQARAGEHPIRQPRGPPPLDELKAKPTSKFEGSKNFAARTRRSAVNNLVKAGMERRRVEGSRSGSMSPVSEMAETSLALSSEDDGSDSGCSGRGSLSGRPSAGSSRTSAHGAIGSERPSRANSFERKSMASVDLVTAAGASSPGTFAAVFKNAGAKVEEPSDKKAPMLVLTSADKRKSSLF